MPSATLVQNGRQLLHKRSTELCSCVGFIFILLFSFVKKSKNSLNKRVLPQDYMMGALVSGSVFVGAILCVIAIISFRKYRDWRDEKDRINEEKIFATNFNGEKNMSNLRLVNQDELEMGNILGRGAFGTVFEGRYKPFKNKKFRVNVAIKVLNKCKYSDEKAIPKLSEELINVKILLKSLNIK